MYVCIYNRHQDMINCGSVSTFCIDKVCCFCELDRSYFIQSQNFVNIFTFTVITLYCLVENS